MKKLIYNERESDEVIITSEANCNLYLSEFENGILFAVANGVVSTVNYSDNSWIVTTANSKIILDFKTLVRDYVLYHVENDQITHLLEMCLE